MTVQAMTNTGSSLRWNEVRDFIVKNKPPVGKTMRITSPFNGENFVPVADETSFAKPDVATFDVYLTNQEEPPRTILQLDLRKGLGLSTLKLVVGRGKHNHNETGYGEYEFSRFDPKKIKIEKDDPGNGVLCGMGNYIGDAPVPNSPEGFLRGVANAFGANINGKSGLPDLDDSFYVASLAALEKLINK